MVTGSTFIYILLCLLVGYAGRNLAGGWIVWAGLSFFFSPLLVGLVVILLRVAG